MHLPLSWIVPSVSTVHCCSGLPLNPYYYRVVILGRIAEVVDALRLVVPGDNRPGPAWVTTAGLALARAACGAAASKPAPEVSESRTAGTTTFRRAALAVVFHADTDTVLSSL